MIDTSLNGLVSSGFPNVYVKRIKIEQQSFTPPKKDKFGTDVHLEDVIQVDLVNPEPINLKLTFDLTVQVPVTKDEMFEFLFDSDILQYVSLRQAVFYNDGGRQDYIDFLNLWGLSTANAVDWLKANGDAGTSTPDWKVLPPVSLKEAADNMLQNALDPDVAQLGLDAFKVSLPDGTSVYEIPLTVTTSIGGIVDTSHLSSVITLTLDADQLISNLSESGVVEVPNDVMVEATSNLVGEVIIKNGSIQKSGMMFTVSQNQESKERLDAFGHLNGQVWLGGVHKMPNGRYMAGSKHEEGWLHPFLDVHYVDNNKIQDFRQVERFNKLIFDFSSIDDLLFGGSNKQLGSGTSVDSSKELLSLFSPLQTSTIKGDGDKGKRVRLAFGVDFPKLIKTKCSLPRLLDYLAQQSESQVQKLLNKATLLNLRIYRKRIDIPDTQPDKVSNKKLIYNSSTGTNFFPASTTYKEKETLSYIKAVNLYTPDTANSGQKYYTVMDFDHKVLVEGEFEYTLELEYIDPVIPYFKEIYDHLRLALDGGASDLEEGINQYVQRALLGNSFNAYTGLFKKSFITQITTSEGYTAAGLPKKVSPLLDKGIILNLLNFTRGAESLDAQTLNATILSMLTPQSATPDSIIAVQNILETLAAQVKNVLDTFSTQKMPKTDQMGDMVDAAYNSVTNSQTPKRVLYCTHTFRETVNTSQYEAGYNFMIDVENKEPLHGLKTVSMEDYYTRIHSETSKYFVFSEAPGAPLQWAYSIQVSPPPVQPPNILAPLTSQTLAQNVRTTAYAYLTIPSAQAVTLPSTVTGFGAPAFQKAMHDLIRYKRELYESWSGTERSMVEFPMDSNEKGKFALISKELQLLDSMGVNILPGDFFTPAQDFYNAISSNDPEPIENIPENLELASTLALFNPKLIRFAAALIDEDLLSLGDDDLIIQQYDANNSFSNINREFWKEVINISQLPNQIKALIVANINASTNILNPQVKYLSQATSLAATDGSGFVHPSRFGEFWLKHQNIAEVQYLSGYEITAAALAYAVLGLGGSVPITYEQIFPAAMSSPTWKKLDHTVLENFGDNATTDQRMLCRIVRYKNSLYNNRAFELLGLPLYNQHFFIKK